MYLLVLMHIVCLGGAWKHLGTGARGISEQVVEADGQTWDWEKVLCLVIK